jgi:hypothetical protein
MAGVPTGVAARTAAQYGRMVHRRIAIRALFALCVLGLLPPALWLVGGVRGLPIVIVELVVIGAMLVWDRQVSGVLERRARGNEGEVLVGGILDDMRSSDWLTLHDINTGHGNIDHLVVGPGGLLTVETKSHRGRVRAKEIDRAWLSQAYAQRKYVESITEMKGDSLLVFSRAYLDRAPSRQRGVLVLPARMLAGHLERRKRVLTPEEAHTIYERLVAAFDAQAGC